MENIDHKKLLRFYKREYRIKTGRDLVTDILGTDSIIPPSIPKIEGVVCQMFNCSSEELRRRIPPAKARLARRYFYQVCLRYYTSTDVGHHLGRHSSGVRAMRSEFVTRSPIYNKETENLIIKQLA